jgi:hypothetical protein
MVMKIDFEVDARRVLRQAFLLHRESNIKMTRGEFGLATRDELLLVGER